MKKHLILIFVSTWQLIFSQIDQDKKLFFLSQGCLYSEKIIIKNKLKRPVFEDNWYQQFAKKIEFYSSQYQYLVHQKYRAPVYIDFVSEEVGYGLFAEQDIAKGTLIGEYTGELQCIDKNKKYDLSYAWIYPVENSKQSVFVVNAKKIGNELRFVNHSNDPNIEIGYLLGIDQQLHIIFIAKKLIKKGEQLLVDYGTEYWLGKSPQRLHN